MKEKIYSFTYPFSKEYLFEKVKKKNIYDDCYIKYNSNDLIFVGVERLGHSSGAWYVGRLEEKDGKTYISGSFVIDPDDNGNPRKNSNKSKSVFDIIHFVFLLPIFIIITIFYLLFMLFNKITKKKIHLSNEEKLDHVMIDYLCCEKTE